MRNFSVLSFDLGSEPQAHWRLEAVECQEEGLAAFAKDAAGLSFHELYLKDDDSDEIVATAIRVNDCVEINVGYNLSSSLLK